MARRAGCVCAGVGGGPVKGDRVGVISVDTFCAFLAPGSVPAASLALLCTLPRMQAPGRRSTGIFS